MHSINRLNKCFAAGIIKLLAMVGVLLLSGCQTNETQAPEQALKQVAPAVSSQPQAISQQDSFSAEQENRAKDGSASVCQRELAALSKLNPPAYAVKKQAFETLLRTASVYNDVRNDINEQTRDTLDALYKYKTQKICSDIEQAIQQSLISRGESVK